MNLLLTRHCKSYIIIHDLWSHEGLTVSNRDMTEYSFIITPHFRNIHLSPVYMNFISLQFYILRSKPKFVAEPVSQDVYLVPEVPLETAASDAVISAVAPGGQSAMLARTKRGGHGHHLPIWVNTFQMTDHHANFKWGVRHNVGH